MYSKCAGPLIDSSDLRSLHYRRCTCARAHFYYRYTVSAQQYALEDYSVPGTVPHVLPSPPSRGSYCR
jgi:hypothetical protein